MLVILYFSFYIFPDLIFSGFSTRSLLAWFIFWKAGKVIFKFLYPQNLCFYAEHVSGLYVDDKVWLSFFTFCKWGERDVNVRRGRNLVILFCDTWNVCFLKFIPIVGYYLEQNNCTNYTLSSWTSLISILSAFTELAFFSHKMFFFRVQSS
jgi:hypothetical protein